MDRKENYSDKLIRLFSLRLEALRLELLKTRHLERRRIPKVLDMRDRNDE